MKRDASATVRIIGLIDDENERLAEVTFLFSDAGEVTACERCGEAEWWLGRMVTVPIEMLPGMVKANAVLGSSFTINANLGACTKQPWHLTFNGWRSL